MQRFPHESTLRMLDELANIDPKDPRYYLMRGNLLAKLEDYNAAEAAFQRALELEPDNAQYRRLLETIRQRH